ncbi:MAG: hypothetical protein EOO95_02265 [Pedobacter sp.]|nr:MAG: hypothetical protein EOO95_02265 [Pedobacter sp.]
MNTLNNRNEISDVSKGILDLIFKLSAEYSTHLEYIGHNFENNIDGELKRILLPYMIAIYGKMLTAYRLLNGYSLEDLHPEWVGVSNDPIILYDLIRSMYECFLQSHFIQNRYQSYEDRKYIILWWGIRALSERAQLATTSNLENQQLKRESIEIDNDTQQIVKQHSDRLSKDKNDFGFYKTNKLANWPKPGKLYDLAGIHKSHHEFLYKISSLYAHAEPFALMQVRHIYHNNIHNLDDNILTHGRYIVDLSLIALQNFSKIFPEMKVRMDNSTSLHEMINKAEQYFRISRAAISKRE